MRTFRLARCHDHWYPHQLQQTFALVIVFTCDFHCSAREPICVLGGSCRPLVRTYAPRLWAAQCNKTQVRTCLFCFFDILLRFLSLLKPFRQLYVDVKEVSRRTQHITHHARLQIRWLSIEYIGRFDSILHYTDCSIKESHQVTEARALTYHRPQARHDAPRCLSRIIRQHLAILLPDCDHELVY